MTEKKIEFSPDEKKVVMEDFQRYLQTVTLIARLKGLNPQGVKVAPDQSGFLLPEEGVAQNVGS